MHAIRATFPEIYTAKQVLEVDINDLKVGMNDFTSVLSEMVPSMQRSGNVYGAPAPAHLEVLLEKGLTVITRWLDCMLDLVKNARNPHKFNEVGGLSAADYLQNFSPRFCLYGSPGMGLNYYTSSIIHHLESGNVFVRVLNMQELLGNHISPESAILTAFTEIKRNKYAAILLPNLHCWWDELSQQVRSLLLSCLNQLKATPTILGITLENDLADIPQEILDLFPKDNSKSWRIMFRAEPPNDVRCYLISDSG